MHNYSITLPNEKAKAYSRISLLVIVINMLAFGLTFWKKTTLAAYVSAAIMLFLLSACLLTYMSKKISLQNKATVFCIGVAAVAWVIIGDVMLAVLMAAVAAVSFYTLKEAVISFDENGISYPSFPKRFYLWSTTKRAMIKDNVLTLDLQGNQLLQFALPEKNLVDINVKSFNGFCQQHINKAMKEVKEVLN